MKTKISQCLRKACSFMFVKYFLLFCVLFSIKLWAVVPQYQPLSLVGFNADVVCNSTDCTGSTSLDGQWYLYSKEKKVDGALLESIISKNGVEYQLASFDQNNALTIGSNGVSAATLELAIPTKAKELWFLGMSASGQKNINIVVNYTDNTFSNTYGVSFSDWFQSNGDRAAYYGMGRCKGTGTFDASLQFGLFERLIPVDSTKFVKSIDFNYSGTDKTYTTIFAISAYLGGRGVSDKELYMISNAHFDTQWDWDVQTSIDQYVKNTLEGNFNLFEKYPDYKFNFEGAIKYMFAKEYYPDLYKRLRGYVSNGRWHISGGSVDANDVMVPSAESIIRNFLLGQDFYKKEFGIKGGSDIMLPDCFGFPYSLPTLAKYCGVVGFHTQKLTWGSAYNYDDFPHYGLWKGVDGSEIYAVYKPGAYVTQYKENLSYNGDVLTEILANKQKLGTSKTVRYFGTGDRGGSIDESTADWLEKSLSSNGPVKVNVVTPDEFFSGISADERSKLSVWDNELPMTAHGAGCYTSQSILKYWNRKGELLADATEKSSVFANYLGGLPYQSAAIHDSWIRLLWHQFHDDLTGTSIPKAYSFSCNDHVTNQLTLSNILNNAVGAISRKMDTQVVGIPIIVYNPLSIQREDVVEAKVNLETEPQSISVYNPLGEVVPTQMIEFKNGVLSFIFKANVPSLGYATYDLRINDNSAAALPSSLNLTTNTIENSEYIVKINTTGDVYSILDKKQANKELLKSPIRMAQLSDQPGFWASWEVSWDDVVRTPYAYINDNVNLSIAENGPLRSTLKISRSKNGSQFVQFIRLTSGVNEDRIDFVNEVDWQTKGTLLKAVFPLNASNSKATFDLSIGTIERGNRANNLYEVCGHQWADLTDSGNLYGVSILNDCKYGWDKQDNNTLRLTLIHTPAVGSDRQFQQYQDLGLNKFVYSFYRHMGKWNETTQWQAAKLNQPLLAYEASKHSGDNGKSVEFVRLNTNTVAIKALKKAENSEDLIVRVYELTGANHDNVELTFPANIVSAKEVNGLEEEIGVAAFSGNKISFPISKYQPKSFAVKLANPAVTASEPESRKALLTYNIDVMSTDSLKKDGKFVDTYYAYPAELFSDEIVADGIKFSVGPRNKAALNAVQCKGQEISIPQSTSNKKLYILAASQNPEGSNVNFAIDGVNKPIKVGYFAANVGEWGTVYSVRNYKKENIAFVATHRHNLATNKNDSYSYLYVYKYAVAIDGDSKKIVLPNNPDVVVFAVSASDNENDNIAPATNIANLPEFEYITPASEADPCGTKIIPSKITASGYSNTYERPVMAADNNPYTKWTDDSSALKWLQYTFSNPVEICQWNVVNAGIEGDSEISSDYTLQYYINSSWVDVDVVISNILNKTIRTISPITTDRVRIKVLKGQQNGTTARIYSFDVFGRDLNTGLKSAYEKNDASSTIFPNPFSHETTITCNISDDINNVVLDVYDVTGTLVSTKTYPVSDGLNKISWINENGKKGLYLYKISGFDKAGVKTQLSTGKMIIK